MSIDFLYENEKALRKSKAVDKKFMYLHSSIPHLHSPQILFPVIAIVIVRKAIKKIVKLELTEEKFQSYSDCPRRFLCHFDGNLFLWGNLSFLLTFWFVWDSPGYFHHLPQRFSLLNMKGWRLTRRYWFAARRMSSMIKDGWKAFFPWAALLNAILWNITAVVCDAGGEKTHYKSNKNKMKKLRDLFLRHHLVQYGLTFSAKSKLGKEVIKSDIKVWCLRIIRSFGDKWLSSQRLSAGNENSDH